MKREYYDLFKQVGIKQLQSSDGCRAKFSAWSVGWLDVGDYKGYLYKPKKVENVVNSLDNLPIDKADTIFYHRKIDDNWYIYYYHWQ